MGMDISNQRVCENTYNQGQNVMDKRQNSFPRYTESVKFKSKSRETVQNENHTEDWALGSHPRDNGHVTH